MSGPDTNSDAIDDFAARVCAALEACGVVMAGSKILVAVSGGLDSTLLLHVLARIAPAKGCRLEVAHFNHLLRGAESDGDEAFVKALAADLELPFHSAAAEVLLEAKRSGVSVEMAARDLRHEFLAKTAVRCGAAFIALGHHADDQAETFLLRLLRGSAGGGLACMSVVAPSPMSSEVRLLRPFLGFLKAVLEAVAASSGLAFRQDASNDDLSIPRNLVRRTLIPVIRSGLQPAVASVLSRTTVLLGDQADYVRAAALSWLENPAQSAFEELHAAVQREVIVFQLISLSVAPDFEHVENLRLRAGEPVHVPGGLLLRRNSDGLICQVEATLRQPNTATLQVPLTDGAAALKFDGLDLQLVPSEARTHSNENVECFDADAIGASFTLRHRQPGDRFAPIGLGAAALLQDLLVNARVPFERRDQLVVACNAWGEIFWVEGLRIGEAAKVTPETTRFVSWQWRRTPAAA